MGDFRIDWFISGVNLVWKSDFPSFSVEFKGLAISVYQNIDTATIFEYQKSYGHTGSRGDVFVVRTSKPVENL